PWTKNAEGRGPAWNNSLFEDNAEFGLGMRLAIDQMQAHATGLLTTLRDDVGVALADGILHADQSDEVGIYEQRQRIALLCERLKAIPGPEAKLLVSIAENLNRRSVWIIGHRAESP
ncbi:MAG TPA: hypothetical protein DCZ13_15905, partial [Porticoccaceae bacterium]|nr:hypothetical protein [Porticoccaceae bacterium]